NAADSEAVPITRSPPTRRYSIYLPDPIDIEIANAESSPTNPAAARPSHTQLSVNGFPLNTTSAPPLSPTAPTPSPLSTPASEPYTPAEKRDRDLIFSVFPHAPREASTNDLRWADRGPRLAHEGPPEGPWTTWYCHHCGLRKDFPLKWLNTWKLKLRC